MKTLFKLAALPLFVLTIGNTAVAQTTFYVNVVIGLDGYDGLSPTPNPPANGPKQTIANAILASSPGDNIIVDYGNGILYNETVVVNKQLMFGVSNNIGTGAPFVYSLTINNTAAPPNNTVTFTGPWNVQQALTVTAGAVTFTGNLTAGSLTMSSPGGTLDLGSGLTHQISGTVTIAAGTLSGGSSVLGLAGNFDQVGGTFTASNSTVNLNGSADQTVGASPLLFHNLTLSKPAGTVILNTPVSVNGMLDLGTNKISTGPSTLSILAGGSVARTTGWVIGNLQKNIGAAGTVQLEVGDGSYYTPVVLNVTTLATPGEVTARSQPGDHPTIATSGIDANKSVNRYWSLIGSGINAVYDATFGFDINDKDPFATYSNFIVAKYSGGTWTWPAVGARTATSTQATSLTGFSEFALGEPQPAVSMTLRPGYIAEYFYRGVPNPDGISIRSDGRLFVVNENGPYQGVFLATKGDTWEIGDAYSTTGSPFVSPDDMLLHPDGTVYVVDGQGHALFKIPAGGGLPTAFTNPSATFEPYGIALAPSTFDGPNVDPGDLIIADNSGGGLGRAVWAINPTTGVAKAIAQGSVFNGGPVNVAFGPDGKLYVYENYMSTPDGKSRIVTVDKNGAVSEFMTGIPGGTVRGFTTNPITGEIYFRVHSNEEIRRISCTVTTPQAFPGESEVFASNVLDSQDMEFSRDGGVMYVGVRSATSRDVISVKFRMTVNSLGDGGDVNIGDGIGDDGTGYCTFRAAIQEVNAHPGLDEIYFDIPGPGPHTLQPTSPLPGITDPVIIDGTTQPGYSGSPLIEIDGSAAGSSADGLVITAGNSTIRGLAINRFSGQTGSDINGVGIRIVTNGGNTIEGNYIGTDPTGMTAAANRFGLYIDNAPGNIIGGTGSARNIISGNTDDGIGVLGSSATGNVVAGNYIGIASDGATALGNGDDGINIESPDNTVGGNTAGAGNIVSANQSTGVAIVGSGATDNKVFGNYVGTNALGTVSLANGEGGIFIGNGASNNFIGGTDAAQRNVISGNTGCGIMIASPAPLVSSGNSVTGNYIGTSASGDGAVPNSADGVYIGSGASATTVGVGNVISGNSVLGIRIQQSDGNFVRGNRVGTNALGTLPLGNGLSGIWVQNSNDNTVGGTEDEARNVFSGNAASGVVLIGDSKRNKVQGNYIGVGADGVTAISNLAGVYLLQSASDNTIGGTNPGERNIISGNNNGVVFRMGAHGNRILGNFIGTDINGTNSVPNGNGVLIERGASTDPCPFDNIIGPTNVISGNTGDGINIRGGETVNNVVEGNFIGTDVKGTGMLGNHARGVSLNDGAHDNTIGGTTAKGRNIISGNGYNGVGIYTDATANKITGNFIGTDVTGTTSIGNGHSNPDIGSGIAIWSGANVVGGTTSGSGNLISGNQGVGIKNAGAGNGGNTIQGNRIGTDASGKNPLGNTLHGIYLREETPEVGVPGNNMIGGLGAGAGNIIAHNGGAGIALDNVTTTNGTDNRILSNSIYSNGGLGIDLGGDGVTSNDVADGDPDTGPNNLQNYPVLSDVQFASGSVSISGALTSTANTEFTLQFFSNQLADPTGYGEGQKLLGTETVMTNGSGSANFDVTYSIGTYAGQVITATATDPDGNTSEFSKAIGGTVGQVVAAGDFPMTFQINDLGVPTISDDSELIAIRNAFAAWENIATSRIDFTDGGVTSARYASAEDGINLVTFQDDQFPFAPGVLAVAAKTIDVTEGDANGHIVDADVVFNPAWIDHPKYPIGTDPAKSYFDIQSIATHEIGHVVGLVHSGVINSTMFFVLQKGTNARVLRTDDIAWASYRYKETDYGTFFGSISGTVTDGYNPGAPVAGALLIATNVSSGDSIHAYSDAAGHYLIPGLATGQYKVSLQPLDGNVGGYTLRPSNISAYIYAITKNIDYPHEFYNGTGESDADDPSLFAPVSVAVGIETPQVNLVTNRDDVPPTIVAISPQDVSTGVKVTSDIILKFSEPIIPATLENAFSLKKTGDPTAVVGKFTYLNKNQNALFTPGFPLAFNTVYTAEITEALTDVHGVALASVFRSSFTTEAPDLTPPILTQIDPPDGEDSVFVTTKITMVFSEQIDPISLTVSTDIQTGSFALSSIHGKVDGTLEFNESKTSAVFTPRRSLLEDAVYTVVLTDGVTDIAGNAIDPFTSTFTTIPQSPPQVLAWGPADNATGISVNTSVFVDFSEPMDTASIRAHTTLTSAGNELVETELEFLYANSRVVLRPLLPLSFSTSYTLTLTTDITDASGVHLVTGMTSNFTTGAAPSKPSIATIEPPKAIIGVEVVIGGEGFDPSPTNNVVLFNNVSAPVIAASLTSITTKVPQGLLNLTNPLCTVTVTVNGVTSNGYPFEVLQMVADRTNVAVAGVDADEESKDADITPDGGIAYVTNTGADNVAVIDLNTASVIGTVAVGDVPLKIAINPAGTRAYVTNHGSNTVSIIDLVKNSTTYNKVIKDIPVGLNPIGVAVTPDGRRVYVANYTSKDVTVIDTDPKSGTFDQAVGNVDTDAENRDIDVSPDGGLAFVTGTAGLTIINIDPNATDPATGESLYNMAVAGVDTDTETRDVEVTPDGGIAIVTTMSGDILLIDVYPKSPSFGQAVGQVDTEGESRDVDVSPDGMFVYITDYDRNTVTVYELAYAAGASPMGVTGQRASGNPVVAADVSLKLVATIQVGPAPEGIVIDAAGQRAVVANSGNGTATIIDISTTEPADAVQQLTADVRLLETQGRISKGHATSLVSKVNAAYKQLLKNKPTVAVNELNAFIREVQALITGGAIRREDGDALIYAANRVIVLLTGPSHKLAEANLTEEGGRLESDLVQNYPNPFNPQTTISFDISERAQEGVHVRLLVYNVVGQVVATLVDEVKMPGRYTVRWDGTSSDGAKLPSGIYFCQLTAGGFTKVNKMILAK